MGLGVIIVLIVLAEMAIIYVYESFEAIYIIFNVSLVPFLALLIGGGLWLKGGGLPPARYRRIGAWTTLAIAFWGGLFLLVGVLTMPPEEAFGAVRWAVGVGAGLGLLVGMFEAKAIETERKAERRRVRERELEERKDRLEEFASIVSHDLRNPLTVAMGRLDLAQAEHDSEHLDAVERALSRIEVILTETLELARQGQVITEPETIDLSEIARAAWEHVDTGSGVLQIDGTVSLDGDPERLVQVFENLFRNAIEHGNDDVTIRVGTLPNHAGFYIEDNGPGIPPEHRDAIFEPGHTTKSGGTGFGLTIVRSIISAHDWAINVTEGEEGGARFEIRRTQLTDGSGEEQPAPPQSPLAAQ